MYYAKQNPAFLEFEDNFKETMFSGIRRKIFSTYNEFDEMLILYHRLHRGG